MDLICPPSIAGGELFERIVDDNFEHTEPTSARYMQQILEGMQYVHKQNIVHLDLKPENIVCVNTTGTQIKIIDFGLASKLGEFVGFVGTGHSMVSLGPFFFSACSSGMVNEIPVMNIISCLHSYQCYSRRKS